MKNFVQIIQGARLAIIVALLNLTGLGVGYLYMKRWRSWLLRCLITVGLIVIGFLSNASQSPLLWFGIFALWVLWMTFEGAWRAQKLPPPLSEAPTIRQWTPAILAGLLIVLEITGLWGYVALGQQEYASGMTAYRAGDCRTALESFNRVTTLYELTLSANVASADEKIVECSQFVSAEGMWKKGEFANAISQFNSLIERTPKSPLVPFAREAISQTYGEWALKLRESGETQTAIEKYRIILKEYSDTTVSAQVKPALAETYGEWATQLRKDAKYADAISKYQLVQKEYPDTPAGKRTAELIAETYADWAMQLRRAENYREAIDKYQIILNNYRGTPTGAQAEVASAETYGEWGTQLRKGKQYNEAIDKYQTLLKSFPNTPTGKEARTALAETYRDWAAQLRMDKRYDEAVAKYQIILRDYAETPTAALIPRLLIQTHSEWGDKLRTEGKFKEAIEKYQYVTKNSTLSEEIATATKVIGDTYNDWGKWHYSRRKYLEAMEKYTLAMQATSVPVVIATANQGYNSALVALSEDSTGQGRKVMDQTVTEVLAGKPASSPAVGLAKDQPGKALPHGAQFTLPIDLQAVKPAHLMYVISVESETNELERCSYRITSGRDIGAMYTLVRKQWQWRVRVLSTLNAKVVAERHFTGSPPGSCPDQYYFTYGATVSSMTGNEPSTNDVISWLRTVIK